MTSSLQELIINGCDSLPASPFSDGIFLPTTLKRLEIENCKGVESLAEMNVDPLRLLQVIRINGCEGVESLAEINLEPLQSLQEIRIVGCKKLRSLPGGLHTLSHLTSLEVGNCPALELECFPPLPLAISRFSLYECPKIKALPHQLHRLTSLRHLTIEMCESITCFPNGGLLSQLQSLHIGGCENMKQPVKEWLPHLTSLIFLYIEGSVGGLGEEVDLLLPLPSSLLRLYIYGMKKVKRLPTCLPPSLRTLEIYDCPKLRKLPLDDDHHHGLPPSLEELAIINCGILKERFRKRIGGYRHLLREIPRVELVDFENEWDFENRGRFRPYSLKKKRGNFGSSYFVSHSYASPLLQLSPTTVVPNHCSSPICSERP